ncbi:hypothetical protein BN1723_019198, partial [Verticillium longisporum]
AMAEA